MQVRSSVWSQLAYAVYGRTDIRYRCRLYTAWHRTGKRTLREGVHKQLVTTCRRQNVVTSNVHLTPDQISPISEKKSCNLERNTNAKITGKLKEVI